MYNVYLISAEINNSTLYKIGYTRRNVEDRIKEFKTGNASNFEIVSFFKSKWGTKIEKILHKNFNTHQINGEWFSLDINQVVNFTKTCESIHNNFEILNKYNTYIIDKGGAKKIK